MLLRHSLERITAETAELIETVAIVVVGEAERAELGATLSPLSCGL